MISQREQIREHLVRYGHITPLEALHRYGCFRLSAVIFDLRADGLKIDTEINKEGKKYANYIHNRKQQSSFDFS